MSSRPKGYWDKGKAQVPTGRLTPTGRPAVALLDHNFENFFTGRSKLIESKFGPFSRLSQNQQAAKSAGVKFEVNKMTPESASGTAGGTLFGGATSATPSDSHNPQ